MLVNDVWFVRIGGVINGWFMVYMGDEVEDKLVVAHDEMNKWWELRSTMKHDELGDMGHLVLMR